MRIPAREFLAQPLRALQLVDGIPLEDAWVLSLTGGGSGRTVEDLRAIMVESRARGPAYVRLLFWLRTRIGALLGWDSSRPEWGEESFVERVPEADRSRSLVEPGTPDGSFRLLYRFEREQLGELRNATVHAFISLSLVPISGGYLAYMGVFVKPVHRLTRLYMRAIAPFRRWIVYPAITRAVQAQWSARYGSQD